MHVFDNLYPAIIQCFTVILLGYVAGRLNIVSATQATGLGIFVSHFALPGIVVQSLIRLEFSSVNWKFMCSILAGKTIVFFLVLIFSLLLIRPRHVGRAGLNAIFATQSNDFGVGYPIAMALYGDAHPELIKYIALVVPVSFLILNPIGYVLLEVEKRRSSTKSARTCSVVLHIVKGVLLNPVVMFTIVGIVANFIFRQNIPKVVDNVIDEFARSFSATTLFYLGLSMVGKISSQLGQSFITPLLLIFAKMILLPLTIREMVQVVGAGDNANQTRLLADYGFLYGTFPTAPTVFVYATMYGVAVDMVASALVVCTFVSAPVMFLSARMVTLQIDTPAEYEDLLVSTSFNICILSIVCVVWVAAVFALSRRYRVIPHQFTLALLFSNFIACLGMLLFYTMDKHVEWARYIQYIMSLIGILSTRFWTASLALTLCLLKTRSLCYVLRIRAWLFIGSFGIPTISAGLLMMMMARHKLVTVDPMFQYGQAQVILSAVVLAVCLIVTIASLVVEHRSDRSLHSYRRLSGLDDGDRCNGDFTRDRVDATVSATNQWCSAAEQASARTDTESARIRAVGTRREGHCYDPPRTTGDDDYTNDIEIHAPTLNSSEPVTFVGAGAPKVYGALRASRALGERRRLEGDALDDSGSAGHVTGQSRDPCDVCTNCPATEIEDLSLVTPTLALSNRHRERDLTSGSAVQLDDPLTEFSCADDTCSDAQRRTCSRRLHGYGVLTSPQVGDEVLQHDLLDYQLLRHRLLILILIMSMFTGLVLCLWRLLKEDIGGVYIELEFMDAVFNFGQGFIIFAFFGLDTKLIIMPFLKTWRRLWYGAEEVRLPNVEDLDEEIMKTVQQFLVYHMDICQREIVTDIRYRLRVYRGVFTGTDLVDWLVKVGLASGRVEAVAYGQRLLLGRVIHHVTREYLLYDQAYFYRFNQDLIRPNERECPLTGSACQTNT